MAWAGVVKHRFKRGRDNCRTVFNASTATPYLSFADEALQERSDHGDMGLMRDGAGHHVSEL